MTPCKFEDGKCIHCGDTEQGFCEGFTHSTESVMRKEIERLENEIVAWGVTVDSLRAELAELRQQEPIAAMGDVQAGREVSWYDYHTKHPKGTLLFLAAGAQPAPEGYQLVPGQPTKQMLQAGEDAWIFAATQARNGILTMYRAMLKAAKEKP